MQLVLETPPTAAEPQKLRKSRTMALWRHKRKMQMLETNTNAPSGSRVCSKCFRLKRESEYSCRREDGMGKINKICDACLTSAYTCASRKSSGFCPIFWRKRAYTCNTAYRYLLASHKGVPARTVKLTDLPYVCKPQDLANIFDQQNGRCFYCSFELVANDTSVDHATAKSKGGAHHPSNFRITCGACNRLKHTMSEEEFVEFVGEYAKRFK